MKVHKRKFSILLICLHVFLSLGALFGGGMFIIDPSGGLSGMPVTLLEGTPFRNYLLPGLILFGLLGITPIIIVSGLIKRWNWKVAERLNIFKDTHWSWSFSLYVGFAVIIWITVQVAMIKELSVLQLIIICLGITVQLVTLWPTVRGKYLN